MISHGPLLDNGTISPETIAAIERKLFVSTPIRPADLLFVFGTRHGVPQFLDIIADLWNRRYFKWALVTGGPTLGVEITEAEVLRRGMIAHGIPENIVLTEHAAMNTGENVVFSLPIIEANIGKDHIGSLIAVGKQYTSVRYLMTLQRHWPAVEKMFVPVHYHAHPPGDWHLHVDSRSKVLAEWSKLANYKAAGFIADWP